MASPQPTVWLDRCTGPGLENGEAVMTRRSVGFALLSDPCHLLLWRHARTGDVYEQAVLLSVLQKDDASFERHYAQLKPFYSDAGCVGAGLGTTRASALACVCGPHLAGASLVEAPVASVAADRCPPCATPATCCRGPGASTT